MRGTRQRAKRSTGLQNPGQLNFHAGSQIKDMAHDVAKLAGCRNMAQGMRLAFYKLALQVDKKFTVAKIEDPEIRARLEAEEG